jgi:hypothetical protein
MPRLKISYTMSGLRTENKLSTDIPETLFCNLRRHMKLFCRVSEFPSLINKGIIMKKFLIMLYTAASIFFINPGELVLKSPETNNDKLSVTKFIIKTEKNGSLSGVLSSYLILPAKFTGTVAKDENGNYLFKIDKIKFLTSWPNGWTEGELEATGEVVFINNNENYTVKIKEQIEIWDLLKGEMRYFDKFFRNEDGLKHVHDRMERIKRVIEFVKNEKIFPDHFEKVWIRSNDEDSFNHEVNKFLSDKRTIYPADLVPVKTSNTLEKDMDEAIELFFMYYNMDYFFNKYLPELKLK